MQKKVLLISQYFLPDINAAAFRINDLYKALKKQQYDVTVVTANPQKSVVEEIQQSDDIHRIKLEKVTKKSFINYIKNYFGFMFKSIYHSLFRLKGKKFDYVIVTSPPLFVALGGLIVSFFKRTKLIVDIRDVWPDSAVSAGMLKPNGSLYKVTKKIERFIYKRADVITCVSRPMRNYIYQESQHENIHVLYNGISPESIQNDMQTTINQNNDKIKVAYAGNIGIVQNMGIIVKAAQLVGRDFEFIIIGDGIEREKLEVDAKELNIDTIKFMGTLPKNEAVTMLNQVDLLFFSLIEDPVFDKTIPSKLFDYLLNNKPIVTSIKGEGRDILEELGCALFFDPNDPESFVEALINYKDKREAFELAARNNRKYVIENYNREEMFVKFLDDLHAR